MADIINFGKKTPLTKSDIEAITDELKSLDSSKIKSIFVNITLTDEDNGVGTYTVTKNVDYYDLGFITSYLSNMITADYYYEPAEVSENSELIQQFKKKDEDEKKDDE